MSCKYSSSLNVISNVSLDNACILGECIGFEFSMDEFVHVDKVTRMIWKPWITVQKLHIDSEQKTIFVISNALLSGYKNHIIFHIKHSSDSLLINTQLCRALVNGWPTTLIQTTKSIDKGETLFIDKTPFLKPISSLFTLTDTEYSTFLKRREEYLFHSFENPISKYNNID
eukprot:219728_1